MLEMLLKNMLPQDFDLNTEIERFKIVLLKIEASTQRMERIEEKLDFLMNLKNEAQNEITRDRRFDFPSITVGNNSGSANGNSHSTGS
jgi:hypothetical protein